MLFRLELNVDGVLVEFEQVFGYLARLVFQGHDQRRGLVVIRLIYVQNWPAVPVFVLRVQVHEVPEEYELVVLDELVQYRPILRSVLQALERVLAQLARMKLTRCAPFVALIHKEDQKLRKAHEIDHVVALLILLPYLHEHAVEFVMDALRTLTLSQARRNVGAEASLAL